MQSALLSCVLPTDYVVTTIDWLNWLESVVLKECRMPFQGLWADATRLVRNASMVLERDILRGYEGLIMSV